MGQGRLDLVWSKNLNEGLFFESMGGYLSEVLQGQRLTAIFRSLQEAQQLPRAFTTTDH